MEKAVDDSQTIATYVAAQIAAHNADSTAHLGTGGSLESHKAEDMIDHPAGSVAIDKISLSRVLMTSFESIDGWGPYSSGSGAVSNDFGAARCNTGATSGSVATMTAAPSGTTNFDVTQDCFWRSTLRCSSDADQLAYFGIGYLIDFVDFNGFGFKVDDDLLYAYMGDFSNYVETQITGIDVTALHTYEIRYDAAAGEVGFYVDGTLGASFDSGDFPVDDDNLGGFAIKNTAAAAKSLYILNFMYQQDF